VLIPSTPESVPLGAVARTYPRFMTYIPTERDVREVFLDTSAHVPIQSLDDVDRKKVMVFREQIRSHFTQETPHQIM